MMKLLSFLWLSLCPAAVSPAADEDLTPSTGNWKATFYVDPGVCNVPSAIITKYFAYDGDQASNNICQNVGQPPEGATRCSYWTEGGRSGPGTCESTTPYEALSVKARDALCQLYSSPNCEGRVAQRISGRGGWSCLDGVTVRSFECQLSPSDREVGVGRVDE